MFRRRCVIMLKRAATDRTVTRKFEEPDVRWSILSTSARLRGLADGLACVPKNYTERVLKTACEFLADETKRNTELRL